MQLFGSKPQGLKQTHAWLPLRFLRCAQPEAVYLRLAPPRPQTHPSQLLPEKSAAVALTSQPSSAAWPTAVSTSKELKINEAGAFSNPIALQLHKASFPGPSKGA